MTLVEEHIGQRYVLGDQLGAGGMGIVYRATDRLTRQTIALKRVRVDRESRSHSASDPSTNLRLKLAREFQTLASLRHPHIISVLDYGFELVEGEQRPYFTMTLLENARDIRRTAQGRDDIGVIELLVQTLQALGYLHRRGVIHCDIKPSNVLVDRDGAVKVLDFGLAIEPKGVYTAGGTPEYMAPEVVMESGLSAATDLYSVGVLAYELFAGDRPFESPRVGELLAKIVQMEPDMTRIPERLRDGPRAQPSADTQTARAVRDDTKTDVILDSMAPTMLVERTQRVVPAVPPPPTPPAPPVSDGKPTLRAVIARLLAKNPADRYQDAYAVIDDLCAVAGIPAPEENQAIRESFLQAARFVGRERETERLSSALDEALAGHGSCWLIGGESGVGKSRLVDELRTRALVKGALTLRGQGVEGGGLAYQVWRDAARRLALTTALDDQEAGILKALVPDIDALIGRSVQEAPELPSVPGQQRLALTLAGLLRRQPVPVVLLMEDLQWASESLGPLKQLALIADQLPLLVVGTYRDDERPALPSELPNFETIHLERLNDDEIAALSESMLGGAPRPDLLTLLRRETEGNVFFLVETMRALAEEAGRLSAVSAAALPQQVITGGVQEILRRRLSRVPQHYRPLLLCAAVAGRALDLDVLRYTESEFNGALDLEDWLTTCANVAVLEVQEGRWRFAHDKLRETLLRELPDRERALLQQRIAEAIEMVHPGDLSYAPVLADHWYEAGDMHKAVYWARTAGDRALTAGDYRAGLRLVERALPHAFGEDAIAQRNLAGQMHTRLGDFSAAEAHLETALTLARATGDRRGEAETLKNLSGLAVERGAYPHAQALAEEELALVQALDDQRGIAYAYNALAKIAFRRGVLSEAVGHFRQSVAILEALGEYNSFIMVSNFNGLGIAATASGNFADAITYFERALQVARGLGERSGVATILHNMGNVAYKQHGDYESAKRYYEESLAIRRSTGEAALTAASLGSLGGLARVMGDFASAQRYLEESVDIRRKIGDRSGEGTALNNLALVAEALHNFEDAYRLHQAAVSIKQAVGDRLGLATCQNSLGTLLVKMGRPDEARAVLLAGLQTAHNAHLLPLVLESVAGFAALWAFEGDHEAAVELLALTSEHPARNAEVVHYHGPLRAELEAILPPAVFNAAWARGKARDLDSVVAELLADE